MTNIDCKDCRNNIEQRRFADMITNILDGQQNRKFTELYHELSYYRSGYMEGNHIDVGLHDHDSIYDNIVIECIEKWLDTLDLHDIKDQYRAFKRGYYSTVCCLCYKQAETDINIDFLPVDICRKCHRRSFNNKPNISKLEYEHAKDKRVIIF